MDEGLFEWPNWSLDASAESSVVVGGLGLESILRSIHSQLEYLRARDIRSQERLKSKDAEIRRLTKESVTGTSNVAAVSRQSKRSSRLDTIAEPMTPSGDDSLLKEVCIKMRSLEMKLQEKDIYFMGLLDSIRTRLYLLEEKELHSGVNYDLSAEMKQLVARLSDKMEEKFESMLDMHSGLKLDMDRFDSELLMRDERESERSSAIQVMIDSARDYSRVNADAIDEIKAELERRRQAPDLNDTMAELRRRLNQLQEQENGSVERINKVALDISTYARQNEAIRKDIERISEQDMVTLHSLILKLETKKANAVDLESKVDIDAVNVKADVADLRLLKSDFSSMSCRLSNNLADFEERMTKKFTKLSDYTAKQLRALLADGPHKDEETAAGAGRLKCLVCDHPIKSVEGESHYQPANFYNTVGMLRYRKANDERAMKEELARVVAYEEQAQSHLVPESTTITDTTDFALPPHKSPKQNKVSVYDAEFQYETRRRPKSAPYGRKVENKFVKSASRMY